MSERPPAPTREHHDTFCEHEHWRLVRGATGRPVRHHRTYELVLWDRRVLRTRISRPVDGTPYGPSLWKHILREQLQVTAKEFWRCVHDDIAPDRGGPPVVVPPIAVPLHLVRALTALGVAESRVLALGAAEAAALHAELLQREGS